MADELRSTKHEGQEMVVVQPPHAMRAGRLKVIGRLDPAQEMHVPDENSEYEDWEVVALEEAQLVQAEQPHDEIQLVAGAVIEAVAGAQ